jgi:hypothetical protein
VFLYEGELTNGNLAPSLSPWHYPPNSATQNRVEEINNEYYYGNPWGHAASWLRKPRRAQSDAGCGGARDHANLPSNSCCSTTKTINYNHRSGSTMIDFRGTALMPEQAGCFQDLRESSWRTSRHGSREAVESTERTGDIR